MTIRLKLGFLFLAFAVRANGAPFDHSHREWDSWLHKYVQTSGAVSVVQYGKAKAALPELKKYRAAIESVSQGEFATFSESQKMAFLINAYNAFTVDFVTEAYPISSIKDLGGLFTSPWKKKFFKLFGEEQHLDHIEHQWLRKKWSEPRIHFAVNCASIGCPALRGEAYVATKLEVQLESAAALFLNDIPRNRWDREEKKWKLSKIFDWYGEDFVKKAGSVAAYVTPYVKASEKEKIAMREGAITFLDYDWKLNDAKSSAQ